MSAAAVRLVLHGALLAFLLARKAADAVDRFRLRRCLRPPTPKPRLPAARLLLR